MMFWDRIIATWRQAALDNPADNETRFLHANQLGLGAWAWGDRVIWQYGRGYTEDDLRQAFQTSLVEGVRLIDTAEVYGSGRSERFVGQFIGELDEPVLVATKFFPMPWRLTKNSIPAALRESLKRLGLEKVDLYQIHTPSPLLSVERMMEGMRICVEAGLTRTVGVSNFDHYHMLRAYSELARHNIPLAANQVHYSLLNRSVEKNGLLARCAELGVRLIAYSPIEMGLLTGKYGPENPPPGSRYLRYGNLLARIPPVLKLMTEIGQDHGGKSNAQVALNWVICKGALPIPGAKNADQALQNAGALGWQLTDDEMSRLDEASDAALK
jgi:aryl-alcohol dehydrogenase-like predicted oxidoreductase